MPTGQFSNMRARAGERLLQHRSLLCLMLASCLAPQSVMPTTALPPTPRNLAAEGVTILRPPSLSQRNGLMLAQECERLGWESRQDSVDTLPEFQSNLFYCQTSSCPLLNAELSLEARATVRDSMAYLVEEVRRTTGQRIMVWWAYLRKYSPESRVKFPIHIDSTFMTANFMVSQQGRDFGGGDYFIFGRRRTLELGFGNSSCSDEEQAFCLARRHGETAAEINVRRERATDALMETGELGLNVVALDQGSGLAHAGAMAHGVQPVAWGTRYSVIMFAHEIQPDGPLGEAPRTLLVGGHPESRYNTRFMRSSAVVNSKPLYVGGSGGVFLFFHAVDELNIGTWNFDDTEQDWASGSVEDRTSGGWVGPSFGGPVRPPLGESIHLHNFDVGISIQVAEVRIVELEEHDPQSFGAMARTSEAVEFGTEVYHGDDRRRRRFDVSVPVSLPNIERAVESEVCTRLDLGEGDCGALAEAVRDVARQRDDDEEL